jgi:hypothetical protein
MSNILTKIVSIGKTRNKNTKAERLINISVLTGFFFMIFWIIFLFPKVFIDIKLVLAILFIPGLIISFFISNKIISTLGYRTQIKKDYSYNIVIKIATYLLITIPIGNLLVITFLGINTIFKEFKTETVYLEPKNISEDYSRKTRDYYSHLEVEYNGVSKQINFGHTPLTEMYHKKIKMEISKGFFGYYVIIKRRLI